jgi:hypothetical protein
MTPTKIVKRSPASTLDYLRRLLDAPPYDIKLSTGMQYGSQWKYVTWDFPRKFDTVELLHITDTQFGHVEAQVDRMKEYRDWVLREPNRYVLFGGDMIDAANVFSPGMPWENICDSSGQIFQFCELFAPMRHRILGYVGGNHERRGLKTFGDLGLLIAAILQVPYSSGRQLLDLYFGSHKPFQVDLWHGRGASRTDGAKVMMVMNYVKDHPGSDLYLTGHLHDCFVFQKAREHRIHDRQNVKIKKYYAGMSSSFLNTWGTYAEVSGMSITDVAMLRVRLEPTGHSEVTIR